MRNAFLKVIYIVREMPSSKFFSLNHKLIGVFYLVIGFYNFLVGLSLSVCLRLSLGGSEIFLHNFQLYNTFVTAHGLFMIFFAIMPVVVGFVSNWFLPLVAGTNDMLFPKLNNFSV